MGELRKSIRRMGLWRKYLFLLLLRSPFDAARTWLAANLLRSVFGCLEMNQEPALLRTCAGYGLLCALLFVYNGRVWAAYAAFAAKAEIRIQEKMFETMMRLPLARIDRRSNGEWLTRLNSDIQAAFTMMNGPLNMPHLAVSILNIMLSCLFILKSGLLFLGITWMFAIPQFVINDRVVLRPIARLKEEAQHAVAENTSAIRPLITDADTILLYDAKEFMMSNCDRHSRNLLKINMKIHVRKAVSDASMCLLGIGGYLMILFLGYRRIYCGTMAFSDVVYCFQVRGSVLLGISMLLACIDNLKANAVCVKRINDTLEE